MNKFTASEDWLTKAENIIPLGSQTFSKSRTQYPVGISPLFIEKAKGCYVEDLDGNKYIDLVSSLASITLGYADKGVNNAIKRQLKKGSIFSLPGRLEMEVAEMLVDLIPSAEMVRFGKNGSDATSAAVRLARAYTGREKVAVCGYHGWQDWYIGSTTRNKGVPASTSALTLKFNFNDIQSFEDLLNSNGDQIAAVVIEPMNLAFPEKGFLENLRELTTKHGIVLVFDETITGFRFAKGGAQELFNVVPDLSTFGKGLANGMPISAVVGKREIMAEMEQIFFSGTFGGELLSLAAAKYVLGQVRDTNLITDLATIGKNISEGLSQIIKDNNLNSSLSLSGHSSWRFLNWKPNPSASIDEIRTYFLQEMFQENILILNSHNVNMAIKTREQERILSAYTTVLQKLSNALSTGSLQSELRVKPLPPLFKVR